MDLQAKPQQAVAALTHTVICLCTNHALLAQLHRLFILKNHQQPGYPSCLQTAHTTKKKKLHIWLNILFCFLTESYTFFLLSFLDSCQQSFKTFLQVLFTSCKWTVTQLGKITATVQMTSNVCRAAGQRTKARWAFNATAMAKIRGCSCHQAALPLEQTITVQQPSLPHETIREGETLHWYLNLQNCDHKNKASDLWQ